MRETENRPIVGQGHQFTDEPAGWYPRPDRPNDLDLWYWDGRRWTGEFIPPLDGWEDPS